MIDTARLQRLRDAFVAAPANATAVAGCPPSDAIWEASAGRLAAWKLRELAAHALGCPGCRQVWRLAVELRAEIAEQPNAHAGSERAHAAPWRGWWSLAAASLLAAAVLFSVDFEELIAPTSEPVHRDVVVEAIRSTMPPDRPLPRKEFVLRWTGPEGARFDVQVATEDLRILVKASELAAGEFHVPETALASLTSGEHVAWQVTAELPDGRRLTSRTFVARVE